MPLPLSLCQKRRAQSLIVMFTIGAADELPGAFLSLGALPAQSTPSVGEQIAAGRSMIESIQLREYSQCAQNCCDAGQLANCFNTPRVFISEQALRHYFYFIISVKRPRGSFAHKGTANRANES